ncbi:hypothetical protein C8J56DRAFT_536228 [Mycena floridula]|nr:hypothetical protein C8J56DRAFT_536228 [Mycena floridula]
MTSKDGLRILLDRIFEVAVDDGVHRGIIVPDAIGDILVRILPCLQSLVLLELGNNGLSTALVTVINAHQTLKTAAIRYPPQFSPKSLPTVNTEKLLLHSANGHGRVFSVVQSHNIGVVHLYLHTGLESVPSVDAISIPDLRELTICDDKEATEQRLEQFHALVARHPSLTKIIVEASTLLEECNLVQPHISTFLSAIEAHSSDIAIDFALSASSISDKIQFQDWA